MFKLGQVVTWNEEAFIGFPVNAGIVTISNNKFIRVSSGMHSEQFQPEGLTAVDTGGHSTLVWGYLNGHYAIPYTYQLYFQLSAIEQKIFDACEPLICGYHSDYFNSQEHYIQFSKERAEFVQKQVNETMRDEATRIIIEAGGSAERIEAILRGEIPE